VGARTERRTKLTPFEAHEATTLEGKRNALYEKLFNAIMEEICPEETAVEEVFKGMNPLMVIEALAHLASTLLCFVDDKDSDMRETFEAFVWELRRVFLDDVPGSDPVEH